MSDEAVQDRLTLAVVAPLLASPDGAEGACVSAVGGHALVVAEIVAKLEWLPATSKASTDRLYDVPQVRPLSV